MITIGFAGTAKNTGKTTTALHMLRLVEQAGLQIALTSIGYDGENTDHVTGLPKPRYVGSTGMLIATAQKCLEYGDARYDELIQTGIRTLLGEIVIARVSHPGFVVLAGPNRRVDILPLLDILKSLGAEVAFLDGALNRLAAMTMADWIILSTGAAFDERIAAIASHAGAMESLFHFPKSSLLPGEYENYVTFLSKNGNSEMLQAGSVMDTAGMNKISEWLNCQEEGVLIVPGILEPSMFSHIIDATPGDMKGKTLTFHSPLHILATGQPDIWRRNFQLLSEKGASVNYRNPISLSFITVNPFFPRYLQKTARYVPDFVDKYELLRSVRNAVKSTLVVDILQPPLPDLLSHLKLKKE